jgi:anti-sigma factor RsiW
LKHDDLDKRVSAYIDGALRGPKRERLEREFDGDAHLAKQVDRSRALGRLVREAWNEGPAAPAPDFLLASIRPVLAEIDRERNARPAWQRGIDSFFARFAAALRPSPALATAAAVAFVAALTLMPRFDMTTGMLGGSISHLLGEPVTVAESPITSSSTVTQSIPLTFPSQQVDFSADGFSSGVYDVSPGRPAVLFQGKDGSTTLWLIDRGDLSLLLDSAEGWG